MGPTTMGPRLRLYNCWRPPHPAWQSTLRGAARGLRCLMPLWPLRVAVAPGCRGALARQRATRPPHPKAAGGLCAGTAVACAGFSAAHLACGIRFDAAVVMVGSASWYGVAQVARRAALSALAACAALAAAPAVLLMTADGTFAACSPGSASWHGMAHVACRAARRALSAEAACVAPAAASIAGPPIMHSVAPAGP